MNPRLKNIGKKKARRRKFRRDATPQLRATNTSQIEDTIFSSPPNVTNSTSQDTVPSNETSSVEQDSEVEGECMSDFDRAVYLDEEDDSIPAWCIDDELDQTCRNFDEELQQLMRILNWKVIGNVSNNLLESLMSILEVEDWQSVDHAALLLSNLVKTPTVSYDMCKNSCMAFTGSNLDLSHCNSCGERRLDSKGKARCTFSYEPFIPRISRMMRSDEYLDRILYRDRFESKQDHMTDFFDGSRYQILQSEGYFQRRFDIAFLFTLDGFIIFRQKDKDCWVLALINLNLGIISVYLCRVLLANI
jgi:hypothetical protein